ncbi:serine hydrolase [Streptomyces albidoflavus]
MLLGQLLEQVTGMTAERCVTREVIEPAGLRETGFPTGRTSRGRTHVCTRRGSG